MLHYENKTNKYKWKYINLPHYNRCKPPTCIGHICGHLQGGVFRNIYHRDKQIKAQLQNFKF